MADPISIPSLISRYRASDLAVANGTAVTSWAPSVGTGDLVQATTASQPTFRSASNVGAKPAVRFDGVDDFMTATRGTGHGTNTTYVVICKPTRFNVIEQFVEAGNVQLLTTNAGFLQAYSGTAVTAGTATPQTTPVVIVFTATNTTTDTLHVNGTQFISASTGNPTSSTALRIGSHSTAGRYLSADIAEILVFNTALTAAERATIDSYAQDTYGIVVSDYVASDGTAPTVPTSVTATVNSATSVTVSWSASTDAVGVASYRVRRGGVDVTGATAVTGTSFVDSTVSGSNTYSYTVSAVDAAGNRSAESTAATATTPASVVFLNNLKLGTSTLGLRVGATTASKAYLGNVQVWGNSTPVTRATKIDAATMSGPYYTAIPASPVLDTNSAAKVAKLASSTKYAGLQWVTACFAVPSDPQYTIAYDLDPQAQTGQTYSWAKGNRAVTAEEVEPIRIPDTPNFYPQPGGYADGASWDGWGCVVDPARGIGWAGWRMTKVGSTWQATTSHSFAVPGTLTTVTNGAGRGDGLPAIAGSITVQEAAAAFADATDTYVIPHALAASVPASWADTAFRAPATKTDGTNTPTTSTISQGSRFFLPSSATTASTNRLIKAIVRTLKIYGLYIVDRNGSTGIVLNFERFDPANPGDMVAPDTGAASTISDPASISGVYFRGGFTWDYFDLAPIPWESMQLLRQYDGA